jgi:tetratricopeptide (TPR) repeat protein
MNILRTLIVGLCLSLSAVSAKAQDNYEELLRALAASQSRAQADQFSNQIWELWLTAPDATAQEVLDAAMVRRQSYDYLGAIKHLDRLIESYPDYAEGWNQRATIYFLRGEYEKSLADVAETLAREPRHFGALAGKSLILFNQGKQALAKIAVLEALRYHPFLSERAILGDSKAEDI